MSACRACSDERGEPTGDKLVQLPSGTWVRQPCESCHGLKTLDTDRPTTVRPPFDPAEFARESDARVRAVQASDPTATDVDRPDYRVIAEGDDAVGKGLRLDEALAVLEFAREHGRQHVAIVDDATGLLVDEDAVRRVLEC